MQCKYDPEKISSSSISVILECLYNKLIVIMEEQFLVFFFLDLEEGKSGEKDDIEFDRISDSTKQAINITMSILPIY